MSLFASLLVTLLATSPGASPFGSVSAGGFT